MIAKLTVNKMKPEKKLNIPNTLSAIRLLLAAPLALLVLGGETAMAFAVAAAAVATDVADGIVARKFNLTTEFGKIIDPVADKVFYAAMALALMVCGKLPVWFFCAVVARDLIILAGGAFAATRSKVVIQSNPVGKATAVVLFSALVLSLAEAGTIATVFYFVTVFMLALSLAIYAAGFVRTVKSQETRR